MRWLAAFGATGLLVIVLTLGFGGMAAVVVAPTAAAAADCTGGTQVAGNVPAVGQLTEKQTEYAATIIATGQSMGVPERGWVIAVAVAMQESTLDNVAHGDDWWFGGEAGSSPSRGLFQQMPHYYPGVDVMDPAQAAAAFYRRLLAPTDYRGRPKANWQTVSLAQAAQDVQGSAFPAEYAKHEAAARRVVADLAGITVASPTCQATRVEDWALPLPADRISVPAAEHHDYPAVDLSLRPGEKQPVYTMTAGTATPMNEPGGCGLGVYVINGNDRWLYCHLSEQHVEAGQQVAPGDQLGISGWTGGVWPEGPGGAHLHVQLTRSNGAKVCLQPVIDALKAGQAPPALDVLPTPATDRCLPEWAARAA
jgi:hypothetical protein